jgi:hypothetical protein
MGLRILPKFRSHQPDAACTRNLIGSSGSKEGDTVRCQMRISLRNV